MESKAKKISTFAVQRGILPYTLFGILPNSLYMIIRTTVAYELLLLRPTVGFGLGEDEVEEHRDDR